MANLYTILYAVLKVCTPGLTQYLIKFLMHYTKVVYYTNITWLSECCILAPLNRATRAINSALVEQLPGECIQYKSVDSVPDESQAVDFPTEFLNSSEVSGLPPHLLLLKVGAPIMILRSLDPP